MAVSSENSDLCANENDIYIRIGWLLWIRWPAVVEFKDCQFCDVLDIGAIPSSLIQRGSNITDFKD
jgi:hypothetical protein